MSSTKHREVAKLDRVPLPIEAARVAVTGWQITRTAARVVTNLAGKGPWQQKVIKEIPQTFVDLGPTYVKFGQIIASSPGAFGEELSREFRGLLDRVPPADKDEVHKLVAEELGADPAELFASFDEEPFASASIAQVHYATLHSGEEVVVKIQRPGIRRRVAADLQILKRFAQAVELAKLGRRLSAQDVVADFSDNLAEELNFRLEAQSMDAWVSHLHASPLGKNIRVPQVYWDHTTEKVLTMERVQGIRIDDVAAIRKAGFDGTELVKALLFSLFEGGLRHGLFHGDLHAGNLYVDDQGRIVFFDFGIMGRIDPRTRWLLRELVHALLVKKDHAAAGKIVVLMGAVGTMRPEAEAAKDLEKFATPLTMQTLGELSYADIGKQLSTLADAYDVKLPRELVLIGKQFLYVERYMKLLAPKWQMMSDPQLTGYFANFMVEVAREHNNSDIEV
jgi:predicted unusual protein kinase regulating ubiquinone biosynthesis (AarF/ABC1/UbiB family)